MKKIKLTVPLPESISLNRLISRHWGANKRVKDQICGDLYFLLCEKIGCGFGEVDKVCVKYTLHSPHFLDLDNAEAGVRKILNDCIVRAGLIKNDRPEHLENGGFEMVMDDSRFVEVEIKVLQKNGRRIK